MSDRLYSVESGTSAQTIAKIMRVLFPDARTVCDLTYGSALFWRGSEGLSIVGMDKNPAKYPHVIGDFTCAPFADRSFHVAVLDPPFHTDPGRGKPGIMSTRFGSYKNLDDLEEAVTAGVKEAWRISRLGIIVKSQNYKHSNRAIWMTDWIRRAVPDQEPYDEIHQISRSKVIDQKWTRQLSAWSNCSTLTVFRHDGPIHRERRSA